MIYVNIYMYDNTGMYILNNIYIYTYMYVNVCKHISTKEYMHGSLFYLQNMI